MKHKNPGKPQSLFIFFSILLSLTVSISIAEWVLSYQRQSVEQKINTSEQMDPGMILYDAQLGWKLKPDWSGKHHHYDYDVTYNIDSEGFRDSASLNDGAEYAIIGDSFSFGLGVNDDETFTALLNGSKERRNKYRNYSVPGYSTDQQLLLVNKLKDELAKNIILVVYLGNDVFDNMRAYPLQAEHAKPYFTMIDNALRLENTPVPMAEKSTAARRESISSIVLGDRDVGNVFSNWITNLEMNRRLGLINSNIVLTESEMNLRFSESLKLFRTLVYALDKIIDRNNGRLSVVLLPGRSYVEQPESLSAQYQEYFRKKIKASLTVSSIKVLDLAAYLRGLNEKGIKKLYYPNEGHLTPLGHRYLADFLAIELDESTL